MSRRALSTLAGLSIAVAATAAPDPATLGKEMVSRVGPLLKISGGSLTPEVREAMLDWAESAVLMELKGAGQAVSPTIVAEIHGDGELRDAVYGSMFPPDPSILQNYALLRSQLGTAFSTKYRSLVVAMAVAKRTKGVERSTPTGDFGRDYQPDFWRDESLQVPGSEAERTFVRRIADFMAGSKIAASDLFENPSLQVQLRAYLLSHGVARSFVDEVRKSVGFGERLKNAMVLLGQRPAARDAKPTTVAWLRHLAQHAEARPTSTPDAGGRPMGWPLFPLDTAPWPLLMPLAHPVPLSEANYIWEAYQGVHGPDRYHTYGPYRGDDDVVPDSLRPSKWFWDAWPDRIVHGGMCVPISKGTVDLYSALGKPAMWAGQPGHANLISFQRVDGRWTAEVEQAFAGGPDVTFAQWYFDETAHGLRTRDLYLWSGAEHQLGLALAMNLGVNSYVDTRMAANLFRALPEADRVTVGVRLLRNAIRENPFNPEPWYLLAENASDPAQGAALTQAALKGDVGPLAGSASTPEKHGQGPASDEYWQTLAQFVARYSLLSHPTSTDESEVRQAYRTLRTVPGLSAGDLAGFVERVPGGEAGVKLDANLADGGDAFGQIRMARRYREGDGVAADAAKARDLLTRAAAQGDPAAGLLLGDMTPTVPSDGIAVVASSVYGDDQTAKHLVDGTGMAGMIHDNEGAAKTMWHTVSHPKATPPAPGLAASPAWVRFDFPRPTRFDSVLVWSHNQAGLTDRGLRRVRLYGTTDGTSWTSLTAANGVELPRASGASATLPTSIAVAPTGKAFRSVVLAAESNYGSGDIYGLSAVRFAVRPLTNVVSASLVSVAASSTYGPDQSERNLLNGAGLVGDGHDDEGAARTMWHTPSRPSSSAPAAGLPLSPAWVRFDFARPQTIDALMIWNHNQKGLTDRGFRRTRIYGTSDGTTWFPLTSSEMIELPRASGAFGAEPTTIPNAALSRPLRAVVVAADAADGNYGSDIYGLSAVRFVLKR